MIFENGSPESQQTLILAHGAGAPADSPFMTTIAEAIASYGARVIRFEFPYMHARREGRRRPPDREPVLRRSWTEIVEQFRTAVPLFIGGKSLGGRIASMMADELEADGLVCLGYPFHPPGRPENMRTAHLRTLSTPALILQGTRDPFGTPEEIARESLSPSIRIEWIGDGDHSLEPRRSSGRTKAQNLDQAVAAIVGFMGSSKRVHLGRS